MRVLVTGGAGFIGSHLVDNLLGAGHTVVVADNLSTGKRSNLPEKVSLAEVDIGSPDFQAVTADFGPEVIVHCAAQASVATSMSKPTLDVTTNIVGGINVAAAAVAGGTCNQFVYLNTGGALYGPPDYLPCDEEHPVRPASYYGLSKWTLECYLRLMIPPSICLKVLRLANIYGPRQDPDGEAGVVSIFGARMLRDEPVTIFGDGEQTRDFVYVQDMVGAHELALQCKRPLTLNISSGVGLSVNTLFREMALETGYERDAAYAPARAGELRHSVLDGAKAAEMLDWRPETALRDGLRGTIAWLRTGETPGAGA